MSFEEKIKSAAGEMAMALGSDEIQPRHLLAGMVSAFPECIDVFMRAGVDVVGICEILEKYPSQTKTAIGPVQLSDGSSRILKRTRERDVKCEEVSSLEILICALCEEEEFLQDELILGIGIEWDVVAAGMKNRFETTPVMHRSWGQALISDPGLHKTGFHRNFSDDAKYILKKGFEKLLSSGGGELDVIDVLEALFNEDDGSLTEVLNATGIETKEIEELVRENRNQLQRVLSANKIKFSPDLILGMKVAESLLDAFPSDRVTPLHLFLGLLKSGETKKLTTLIDGDLIPYGPFQHAVIEMIHRERDLTKLDLSTGLRNEVLNLLTLDQMREFRAIPVDIREGKLILASPGYLTPYLLNRIEDLVSMKVEQRLVPAGWFKSRLEKAFISQT